MKSTRIFFWVSLSLLLAPACYSQQWNLKQCIDWASTHNLSVQKQTLKNYETEISLSQAQNQRLPTVNASGEIGIENGLARESGQNYDQSRKNYPYASAGVYSQVDLWNGNRVTNSINKAKAHLEASKLEVSKTVRDVVLYITSSYLDILFQSEKLSILEANKQVTDKQIEHVQVLVDAGSLPKIELSRAQMHAAQEKAQISEAQNRLSVSTLLLAQTLELKGDSMKQFSIVVPVLPDPQQLLITGADSVYANALKNDPYLQSQDYVSKSLEYETSIAKASGLPTVFAKAAISTYANGSLYTYDYPATKIPFSDQTSDNVKGQLAIGVIIPIFNRHDVKMSVAKLKIQKTSAMLQTEQIKRDLFKQSHSTWIEANSALDQYLALLEAAKLARLSFELAQLQYTAGTLDGLSFFIEKNNLAKAESDLLLAKYQSIFKSKQIDLLQGKAIDL